ncbi:MAG: ATP synthase subunit I [Halieaceae bacterium]
MRAPETRVFESELGRGQVCGCKTVRGAQLSRPPAYRITIAQCVVLLLLWLILDQWNPLAAQSAVLGGLISVIPHAWFAQRVFRWRGASMAQQAVKAGYVAEIGKFLLSVAGFALVFVWVRPLEGWAVFAGFGVMLVVQVIGAWILLRTANTGTH